MLRSFLRRAVVYDVPAHPIMRSAFYSNLSNTTVSDPPNSAKLVGESAAPSSNVTLTQKCREKIKEIITSENPNSFLRLQVNSGGCSGFEYDFDVDSKIEDDDMVYRFENGATCVIDRTSLGFLKGAVVDYEVSLKGEGFAVVSNPSAQMSCGCGTSFQPKNL